MGDIPRVVSPSITDGEGWDCLASPVLFRTFDPDDHRKLTGVLDTTSGRVGLWERPALPLHQEHECFGTTQTVAAEPGGELLTVTQVCYTREPDVGDPGVSEQDGPWLWRPVTGELTRLPFPGSTIPSQVAVRGQARRFGVVDYHVVDGRPKNSVGFVDDVTGQVTPCGDGFEVSPVPWPAGWAASTPDGRFMTVTKSNWELGRSTYGDSVLLLDTTDGSPGLEIATAHMVGTNPWSPDGRYVMIYDLSHPAGEIDLDWWVYDTHTQTRRHLEMARANAKDFGPVRRRTNLLAWLDDDTVVAATTKGRQSTILQTLDLETGHRTHLLTITSPEMAEAIGNVGVAGIPGTRHLWDPLL